MLMLPLETVGHAKDALIIVLGKDSLERMREADPVEIDLRQLQKNTGMKLVNPLIMVCYEGDEGKLNALAHTGDMNALIKYLQRGWKFRPERGDHDRGPEPVSGQN